MVVKIYDGVGLFTIFLFICVFISLSFLINFGRLVFAGRLEKFDIFYETYSCVWKDAPSFFYFLCIRHSTTVPYIFIDETSQVHFLQVLSSVSKTKHTYIKLKSL